MPGLTLPQLASALGVRSNWWPLQGSAATAPSVTSIAQPVASIESHGPAGRTSRERMLSSQDAADARGAACRDPRARGGIFRTIGNIGLLPATIKNLGRTGAPPTRRKREQQAQGTKKTRGAGSRLRHVLAALDPSHQPLEFLRRLRAQVGVVHPAKLIGDGEQRLGPQADYVLPFIVVGRAHLGIGLTQHA
jgi:hypothetical protein